MAGTVEIDIDGLTGNEAAQPRVCAHSATPLTGANIVGETPAGEVVMATPTADETVFMSRGACLYCGISCDITVVMEGQPSTTAQADAITFYGVTAGSFLPVLVTKVWLVTKTDGGGDYTAGEADKRIIALF